MRTKNHQSDQGDVIELEESKDDLFARKRICIKTKLEDNILEKFKIIIRGKIFVIRAKELFAWSPVFKEVKEVEYCSDDESLNGEEAFKGENNNNSNVDNESYVDVVSNTCFGEFNGNLDGENAVEKPVNEKEQSSDPFGIYGLLGKKDDDPIEQGSTGKEPAKSLNRSVCSRVVKDTHNLDVDLGPDGRGSAHTQKKGGSVFEILDDIIKVGIAMGYSMEGCEKDIEENHTISDNFLVLYGIWKPSKTKLLVISIYAPQALSEKRLIWNYISLLISRWGGECIVMGDFNEVRCVEEHMGSVFNVHGANAFNDFISNSSLIDVRLEGFSFTWSHPSATKMIRLDRFLVSDGFTSIFPYLSAICLDRHLSDHRPILLHDAVIDYGATHFRFYHLWLSWNGFDQMITRVMVDGDWVVNPKCVKEEFRLHFASRFNDPGDTRSKISFNFPNRLSFDQVMEMECQGINIDNTVTISHLFYANDAIFIGEWSEANLNRIFQILHCFYLASGLKINVQKSHLLGVGIPHSITSAAALILGCSVMTTPFKYLDVTVGSNMSRINAWDESICKLKSRLSKWKLKMLSAHPSEICLRSFPHLCYVPLQGLGEVKVGDHVKFL
nr:RNA-directed DNA polymerase, eukaryota [Tanacetum cinerariifolium]